MSTRWAREDSKAYLAPSLPSTSIATRMKFAVAPERVWERLMFYEQIEQRPPLHLRLLLPVPLRIEGLRPSVGEELKCSYESGHLLKRVTNIERWRHYGFKVIEQDLKVGGGLTLSGGCYALRALASGGTEVTVTTRYESPRRPRWLWKPIEAAVCHMFHRHLLSAMRQKAEAA